MCQKVSGPGEFVRSVSDVIFCEVPGDFVVCAPLFWEKENI